jgi:hypothetical protein
MKFLNNNRRLFKRAFTLAETSTASLALGVIITSSYAGIQAGMTKTADLHATQTKLEQMATVRKTSQVNMNLDWLSNKQLQRP